MTQNNAKGQILASLFGQDVFGTAAGNTVVALQGKAVAAPGTQGQLEPNFTLIYDAALSKWLPQNLPYSPSYNYTAVLAPDPTSPPYIGGYVLGATDVFVYSHGVIPGIGSKTVYLPTTSTAGRLVFFNSTNPSASTGVNWYLVAGAGSTINGASFIYSTQSVCIVCVDGTNWLELYSSTV